MFTVIVSLLPSLQSCVGSSTCVGIGTIYPVSPNFCRTIFPNLPALRRFPPAPTPLPAYYHRELMTAKAKSTSASVDAIASSSSSAVGPQISLPQNRFELEVRMDLSTISYLQMMCQQIDVDVRVLIFLPVALSSTAGIRAIPSLACLPPLPRHERHLVPIVLPGLLAISTLLEAASICQIFVVSTLLVLFGFISPSLFRSG